MSRSTFQVAFEGEALADGEIDVRDLAPSLLALGDVIQAANAALNGKRADAKLMVKATSRGSFVANLAVDVSFLSVVGDLLDTIADNPDRVAAAKELISLLLGGGTVLGGTTVGVMKVLRMLKGKKPEEVVQNSDGTTTIVNNGTMIMVDPRAMKILNDLPTRKAIEDFAVKSTGAKGVEQIRFEAPELEGFEPLALTKEDRAALSVPPVDELPSVTEQTEREALLRIWVVPLQGDYVWRFSDGGEKPFSATIDDTDFINAVAEAKVTFARGDILRRRIVEQQTLKGEALQKDVRIVKVIEHITAPRQPRLI